MKRIVLILMITSQPINILAQSYNGTYVGAGAAVSIKDNALVYCGGGWKNDENTATNYGLVNNFGHIMIDGGASDVFNISNNSKFNLKYTDLNSYGQLYLKGVLQNNISGKIAKEYVADYINNAGTAATSGQQQIGLPFIQFTGLDLENTLGSGWLNLSDNSLTTHGRWSLNSIYRWNNDKVRFDQVTGSINNMSSNNGYAPTDYYVLPIVNSSGTIQWNPSNLVTFSGKPSSDQDGYHVFTFTNTADNIDFGPNGFYKNYYYERYNTYLDDPFVVGGYGGAPAWGNNFAHYLYQTSNPFLTNIDFSHVYNSSAPSVPTTGVDIGIANLYGISYYGTESNTYEVGVGTKVAKSFKITTNPTDGSLTAGDIGIISLLIKPMQAFLIKLSSPATSPKNTVDFSGLRIFKQSVRNSPTYNGPITQKSINSMSNKGVASGSDIKQLAVVLYNSSNKELGRTYYAVCTGATSGYVPNNTIQAYDEKSPIYTSEESLSGGPDSNQNGKIYINAANEVNFAGKAIPMTLSMANEASYLKFELYEVGRRLNPGDDLSNGKSYYIENNNIITKISDGDIYTLNGTNYNLYYDTPLSSLNTLAVAQDITIIAKKGDNWVVRFAKSWKSAKVEVFSTSGQLIDIKENISTANDYVIPLYTQVNGMFLVKATSSKGNIVIKKITK